jgi:putative flavoprotein involved in K+ transport
MAKIVDTVVVGGGQAGLAASYFLTQQGRDHVVLERSRVGESWRSGRWDSFTLVTPNWQLQLPGFHYQGDAPDGFLARDEVVEYLERYAELFKPPLLLGVEATSVEQGPGGGGYIVETTSVALEASNVIVAAGRFQKPKIPALRSLLPSQILQIHSGEYRNPNTLPPGAILVVGSGQSGAQIAEELYQAGRKVYLCVGNAGRIPRRYRGKDMAWWLNEMGHFDRTADTLPSPRDRFGGSSHVSGKGGGRTLNLHQFAKDGVLLLGRMIGVSEHKVTLAPDLMENLTKADKLAADMKKAVDDYITKTGLDVPGGPSDEREPRDGYDAGIITQLDLNSAAINTVIWATGYTFDFGWVRLPVLDDDGYPIQKRGVTAYPGLYFLGLPRLHTLKSGIIFGVGEDAAHITADIAARP